MSGAGFDPGAVLRELFGDRCSQAREPFAAARVFARPDGGGTDLVYDPYNSRLKLVDVTEADAGREDLRRWIDGPDGTAYSKLILYARPGSEAFWQDLGLEREARILRYFADGEDAWTWSAVAPGERREVPRDVEQDAIVELARGKQVIDARLPEGCAGRRAGPEDAAEVSALLQSVFTDYPSPIDERAVRGRIDSGENLFWMVHDAAGELVATASAEIDHQRGAAEMTDCATHPGRRGGGLMAGLLRSLENEMRAHVGIGDLYSLARADEVGMNCVFAKLGYDYTGRLRNNCRMPSGWESMNVWCHPSAVSTDRATVV